MDTLKKESIKAIRKLPDKSGIDDIMYRLYVIDKVKKGKEAVLKGQTITINELKKQIRTW